MVSPLPRVPAIYVRTPQEGVQLPPSYMTPLVLLASRSGGCGPVGQTTEITMGSKKERKNFRFPDGFRFLSFARLCCARPLVHCLGFFVFFLQTKSNQLSHAVHMYTLPGSETC